MMMMMMMMITIISYGFKQQNVEIEWMMDDQKEPIYEYNMVDKYN